MTVHQQTTPVLGYFLPENTQFWTPTHYTNSCLSIHLYHESTLYVYNILIYQLDSPTMVG